jgi:tetratricopeptide (TPR) repeat protein
MPSRLTRVLAAGVVFAVSASGCGSDGDETGASAPRANAEAQAAYDSSMVLWALPTRTAAQSQEATELMEQAVALDPEFAMAYATLAEENAWIHQNWGRTSERAARTLEAAQRAVELAPKLAEAQAAMGAYHYRITKDYEKALEYYRKAQELNPEDVRAMRMTGYVARRAGHLPEALKVLEEANAMSPNRAGAWDLGNTYRMAGRFTDARAAYQQAQQIEPDHWQPPLELAWMDIHERGDPTALRRLLGEAEGGYIGNRWWLAMNDGDWAAAVAALEAPGADPFSGSDGITPRSLMRGLAYRRMGDEDKARAEFEAAREMMAGMVAAEPEDPRTHLALGLALAGLGNKDQSIEAGRHGLELLPPERDALLGPMGQWWLMEIYAMVGERDQALSELEAILSGPLPAGAPTLGMDPWLYTLSDDARFKQLVSMD